jgi:hypothetical protein
MSLRAQRSNLAAVALGLWGPAFERVTQSRSLAHAAR